jgi:hypothetical protein
MTKKLEEMLNLPDNDDIVNPKTRKKSVVEVEPEHTFRDIQELDKISSALPYVKGLGDKADKELEDIAARALTAYEDLMDLGMNVEARYSGRVFEVANSMLQTGLNAKVAKLDKKLKMVELQLKKEKLDKEDSSPTGIVNGEGYVVTDRNSLLERLKGLDKDK